MSSGRRLVATTVPLEEAGALARELRPWLSEEARGLPVALPRDGIAWVAGERALVAWGRVASLPPGLGDSRFATAAAKAADFFARVRIENRVGGWGTGPLAFGAFSFDPDSRASTLCVPAGIVGRDRERAWVTTIGSPTAPEPPRRPTRWAAHRSRGSVSDERWLEMVSTARATVRAGILEKVVLARDAFVDGAGRFSSHRVAETLARRYPGCFTFAFGGLVGASPELLVRRAGSALTSVVLGGSAARGATRREDVELSRRLLSSPKERIEHDLAVATVRDALTGVCETLSVDAEPSLLRLPYVSHLRTRVRGQLSTRHNALELAGLLHPTAATCGVPADKALAVIRELEGFDRGRYCGPVGWVDARGDGEWAIALRCAELIGSVARLFAGAGIVADSDPESELAETELKLRPLLEALGAGS